jgi:hypothetical protein
MEYMIFDWQGYSSIRDLNCRINELAQEGWEPFLALNDHLIMLKRYEPPADMFPDHISRLFKKPVPTPAIG